MPFDSKGRCSLDINDERYEQQYAFVTRHMLRLHLRESHGMSENQIAELEEAAVISFRAMILEIREDHGNLFLEEEPDAWNLSVQDEDSGDGDRPDDRQQLSLF
tara:strand:+ start:91 stop:402 length:312 start_codon:yes stop_codon:yes gene_type:complete